MCTTSPQLIEVVEFGFCFCELKRISFAFYPECGVALLTSNEPKCTTQRGLSYTNVSAFQIKSNQIIYLLSSSEINTWWRQ